MTKEIWFDMDGTIADLYGDKNWLGKLIAEDESVYADARPLLNMQALARILNRLARNGYEIGVVSWLSKNGSTDFNARVTTAKLNWLNEHLHSVPFTRIDILEYGTPKENGRKGILFDDEIHNRENWNGIAYDVNNIIEVLKSLE